MSLQAYVEKRQSDGVASARVIHAEIVRPSVVVTNGKEARATANLEEQLRALIVPSIINKVQWDNSPNRDDAIAQRFDVALGKAGQTDAEFVQVMRTKARYDLLRARIERQGGDAVGPDAGKGERDTTTTTEGPPMWQAWQASAPTVAQVRELLK
jgi:hypothetical protein